MISCNCWRGAQSLSGILTGHLLMHIHEADAFQACIRPLCAFQGVVGLICLCYFTTNQSLHTETCMQKFLIQPSTHECTASAEHTSEKLQQHAGCLRIMAGASMLHGSRTGLYRASEHPCSIATALCFQVIVLIQVPSMVAWRCQRKCQF